MRKKKLQGCKEEKNALLTKLVDFEQNYIIEKQKEFEHYQIIENQINSSCRNLA